MESWGQSSASYKPAFWEHEYRARRYLSNLQMPELRRRYADIARNLTYLVSPDRHVIPLNSFLSSWYWYRKEFHTRLELFLRYQETPVPMPNPVAMIFTDGPRRPAHPNAGDLLYRYAKEGRVQELVESGAIRMWHAAFYEKLEKDPARQDTEMLKTQFLHGPSTVITTTDGQHIPVKGDVRIEHHGPDYYVMCMSCDWDPRLFADFQCDHCAVIANVDELARTIEDTASAIAPGWRFHHNPVEYYDPYDSGKRTYISHATAKDFRFAYQREYRFLLMRLGEGPEPCTHIDLTLGPMGRHIEVFGL